MTGAVMAGWATLWVVEAAALERMDLRLEGFEGACEEGQLNCMMLAGECALP